MVILLLCTVSAARGGTATSISGLYATGVNNSSNSLGAGTQESHWATTYVHADNNTFNTSSPGSYVGNAYVVKDDGTNKPSSYAGDTANGMWITAPGAQDPTSGWQANKGGSYLSGNGTTGSWAGVYLYREAFTVTGTGSGTVTNSIKFTVNFAADDIAKVYVNPSLNGNGSINTGVSTAAKTTTQGQAGSTQSVTLDNYSNNNASFVIGTNYLYIEVDNTDGNSGSQGSDTYNMSGLMVYGISPTITPEVGAWLPVLGALGLFFWHRSRNKNQSPSPDDLLPA